MHILQRTMRIRHCSLCKWKCMAVMIVDAYKVPQPMQLHRSFRRLAIQSTSWP